MGILNIAFHTISCLLALLAAGLLVWVNQERKHSNRLLAFLLILFALQNLVFLLLSTRLILDVPWLLRIPAPTTFLIGPLAYLYTRSVLAEEIHFRKRDLLLLIPAILASINFSPYYLMPIQEKTDYLMRNFYGRTQGQDPGEGIIPSTYYYIIRICWSGIFVFACFRLISQFRNQNARETIANNQVLLNWLTALSSLLAAVWVITILRLFLPTFKSNRFTAADILLGGTILFICLQLFRRPQILYGVFQPLPGAAAAGPGTLAPEAAPVPVIPEPDGTGEIPGKPGNSFPAITTDLSEQWRYKKLVETLFNEKKPYLRRDYSLDQLVRDTHIPRYALSAFINREYGMGFREFLNRRRIDYLEANLDNPNWQNFTLEAVALECGFASRITFFKNVKQITGKTPSEYFRNRLTGKVSVTNS
jgi:AraC-like DNA-binding protein